MKKALARCVCGTWMSVQHVHSDGSKPRAVAVLPVPEATSDVEPVPDEQDDGVSYTYGEGEDVTDATPGHGEDEVDEV
jgi:hypothetical protein